VQNGLSNDGLFVLFGTLGARAKLMTTYILVVRWHSVILNGLGAVRETGRVFDTPALADLSSAWVSVRHLNATYTHI